MASGISPVLVSSFLAEHARVNLPGIVAPLLVDEPVQPPDWDNGTSREAVDRRTIGPSEAAGYWEGSEGGESDEEPGDCTPAWAFASEAAPAASAGSAAIFFCTPKGARSGWQVSLSAACKLDLKGHELHGAEYAAPGGRPRT